MAGIKTDLIKWAAGAVEKQPWLHGIVNRFLIDRVVRMARSRPHPYSTVHNYVSWTSLTDRSYSARHLPPTYRAGLPEPETVVGLFRRDQDAPQRMCPKSTCLFPTFAQYLTDGFIRTRMSNDPLPADAVRQNTSNHEIDLCTLYGRTHDQTLALRLCSEAKGHKGRLKSQMIGGGEYSPYLFDGRRVKPEFKALDLPLGLGNLTGERAELRQHLFAVGGDRVNSAPQVVALNTLLLREHNRLAGELEARNDWWDDERVFETARAIVTVIFIKIVVEEYINHISPSPLPFIADPRAAWHARWNKPNWITAEFSLLYRWHTLIPDRISWHGTEYPVGQTFMDNRMLTEGGIASAFTGLSAQQAGGVGPFNTTDALVGVELKSIRQGRTCELAPYSDYRNYVGLDRPHSFEDISSDPKVVSFLKAHYDSPADVDVFVGLFAEDRAANSPLPALITRMVAVDAFSQAMTNPLLSEHVFNPSTFTEWGWGEIARTGTIRDLVARNVRYLSENAFIGMTLPGWQYR